MPSLAVVVKWLRCQVAILEAGVRFSLTALPGEDPLNAEEDTTKSATEWQSSGVMILGTLLPGTLGITSL